MPDTKISLLDANPHEAFPGIKLAYRFFLYARHIAQTQHDKNTIFDIIKFFIKCKLFFKLEYFDQFKVDKWIRWKHTDDYLRKNIVYLGLGNIFLKNPVSEQCSSAVISVVHDSLPKDINLAEINLPEFQIGNKIQLCLKNIRYGRLDLIQSVDLIMGKTFIEQINNNSSSPLSVLQRIYDINDKTIIPFGCITNKHWLPFLTFQQIKLIFKFKKFDISEKVDYPVTYELYMIEDTQSDDPDYPSNELFLSPSITEIFVNYTYCTLANFTFYDNYACTHLLIYAAYDLQIKSVWLDIPYDYSAHLPGYTGATHRTLSWVDGNDESQLLIDKINNVYVLSFTPSLKLGYFDRHSLGMSHCKLTIESQGDYNIITVCAVRYKNFCIYNGELERLSPLEGE